MPCALNSSSSSSSALAVGLLQARRRLVEDQQLDPLDSALAISTSCCLPTPMSVTSVVGALAQADLAQQRLGAGEGLLPVDDAAARAISLPRKMFSAIDSSGTSASSWWMMMMPSSSLSAMSRKRARLALEEDLAARSCRAGRRRDSTFISVDLPAPFSPTSGVDLAGLHRQVDVVERAARPGTSW